MGFACTVLTLWFMGWIVAIGVIRARAGVTVWHRLQVFGEGGHGLEWTITAGSAALFWPITLVIWLARGRPEPRIVFNEKALERQRSRES